MLRDFRDQLANQTSFDWRSVYQAFGEVECLDVEMDDSRAIALREIFRWIANADRRRAGLDARIGRRAVALIWCLDPSYFGGASLSSIARTLGVTPGCLSNLSAEATREFGTANRSQRSHNWRRKIHRIESTDAA